MNNFTTLNTKLNEQLKLSNKINQYNKKACISKLNTEYTTTNHTSSLPHTDNWMIGLCCRTKKTTDMHDKLVTGRDAEKLSAGVAKDAINRYNARRKSDNVSLSYLYLIVPNLNNVHKRKVFMRGSKMEL